MTGLRLSNMRNVIPGNKWRAWSTRLFIARGGREKGNGSSSRGADESKSMLLIMLSKKKKKENIYANGKFLPLSDEMISDKRERRNWIITRG